jgi:hypothetical protein
VRAARRVSVTAPHRRACAPFPSSTFLWNLYTSEGQKCDTSGTSTTAHTQRAVSVCVCRSAQGAQPRTPRAKVPAHFHVKVVELCVRRQRARGEGAASA